MAIFIDDNTRLIVQGATGQTGQQIVSLLKDFGTTIVAGIAPGHSGETLADVPLYESVSSATDSHDANASLITVPGRFTKDACLEAISAGLDTIIPVAEGVPIHDTLDFSTIGRLNESRIIGPNTSGVVSPGKAAASLAVKKNGWYQPGSVGIVTRSGTLAGELSWLLTERNIGQSTIFSVGGDPYVGTTPAEAFRAFEQDPETDLLAYIGETGGGFETEAAKVCSEMETPVCASIVGQYAPAGKQMGHAGAIGDDVDKLSVLADAGATVAPTPFGLPEVIADEIQ